MLLDVPISSLELFCRVPLCDSERGLPRGVVVYLKQVAPVVQASDPLHGSRQQQIFSKQPCQLRSEKQSLRDVLCASL